MFHRLTSTLSLRSSWRPYRARPGERVLAVREGGVFPPGHPTTRLCLDLLAETLTFQPAARLLDLGCGSGILALAGAALGTPFCVGVDLSRAAARRARENARLNNLGGALSVAQGSTEALRGSFDLLVANLTLAVQQEKVAELTRLAAPQARLILSGFKDTQEDELWELYQAAGWSHCRRRTREEWVIEVPPEMSFTWAGWLLTR